MRCAWGCGSVGVFRVSHPRRARVLCVKQNAPSARRATTERDVLLKYCEMACTAAKSPNPLPPLLQHRNHHRHDMLCGLSSPGCRTSSGTGGGRTPRGTPSRQTSERQPADALQTRRVPISPTTTKGKTTSEVEGGLFAPQGVSWWVS